jgi:uncharacterized protein YndB with AHSA1/START domain
MTKRVAVAPVRKTVSVKAAPERAFEIFTARMTTWWIRSYTINRSPIREIILEPRVGGRWFERGEDGSECQWGRVLAWEPPSRLLLTWQITASWAYDPDLKTEVEARFVPEGAGTRVEIEHRLEGYGDAAAEMFKVFDGPGAWQGLLDAFAAQVSGKAKS